MQAGRPVRRKTMKRKFLETTGECLTTRTGEPIFRRVFLILVGHHGRLQKSRSVPLGQAMAGRIAMMRRMTVVSRGTAQRRSRGSLWQGVVLVSIAGQSFLFM